MPVCRAPVVVEEKTADLGADDEPITVGLNVASHSVKRVTRFTYLGSDLDS